MKLHIADGRIYFRRADDSVDLEDALERVAPGLALPDGMVALSYDAERRILCYFDAKQNAHPVAGEVAFQSGDEILAAIEEHRAAKYARENPPLPPNAAIDAQIRTLELQQLLPRVTREVHLGVVVKDYMRDHGVDLATAIAQLTDPQHAGYNLGFTKLKAFDDRIKALREQRV